MLSTLANRALERDGLGGIRDKVVNGEALDEIIDALLAEDQAAKLAEVQ